MYIRMKHSVGLKEEINKFMPMVCVNAWLEYLISVSQLHLWTIRVLSIGLRLFIKLSFHIHFISHINSFQQTLHFTYRQKPFNMEIFQRVKLQPWHFADFIYSVFQTGFWILIIICALAKAIHFWRPLYVPSRVYCAVTKLINEIPYTSV